MTDQETILQLIRAEREHQDRKWGHIHQRLDVTNDRWMTILMEEVGEVAERVQDGNEHEMVKELVQVAAVAVVNIESILLKARHRTGDFRDYSERPLSQDISEFPSEE
jgi:NTP pyrophosphatase (non-canonical NTP hydrolase)